MDNLEQYIPGAVLLALLVVDRVLGWSAKRIEPSLREILDKTQDLHEWHDRRDQDGLFIWYQRKEHDHVLGRLADTIDRQTTLTYEIVNELRAIHTSTKRTEGEVEKLRDKIN
jgi:hypothetical protein